MANSTPPITNTKLLDLVRTYWAWRRLWIVTTFAFGAFGLLYVLVLKTDMWTASQGIIVRDEANGAVMRLGRFQSQTEMKAAQETILEMARNTQVLREALLEVGPPQTVFDFGAADQNWPSQREIADLADESIGVRAPKGAEFGTTEVIYLDIKQSSRDRAVKLNQAVCKALDNRLRQVRMARAEGVINELVRASNMATEELRKATEQLQIVEREAGADLADLRGLTESNGSASSSRVLLDNVKTELRQFENQHAQLLTDLSLLRDTQTDPERLLSAPASILSAHPGLRKLREGLADAQLATSQLRGRFTSSHPLLYVATTSETEIKHQLQAELSLALATAQKDVENSQGRINALKSQQQQLEERLERLARIRADHANLNQEVRSRNTILQEVERQLADARAARDAASSTSLLTRIDEPVLGERPVGPGRTTILAGMTLAGLFMGLGIVFLLTPLDGQSPSEERWNERLGRRLSDRFPWLADASAAGAPRRRRSDVDRRQSSAAASARPGYFTRRQSDRFEPSPSVSLHAASPQQPNAAVNATTVDGIATSQPAENTLRGNYFAASATGVGTASQSDLGAERRVAEAAPVKLSPSELASLPPQSLPNEFHAEHSSEFKAEQAVEQKAEQKIEQPLEQKLEQKPEQKIEQKPDPKNESAATFGVETSARSPVNSLPEKSWPEKSLPERSLPVKPTLTPAQTPSPTVASTSSKPTPAIGFAGLANQVMTNQVMTNQVMTNPAVANQLVNSSTSVAGPQSMAETPHASTTPSPPPTRPRPVRNMFRPNQAIDAKTAESAPKDAYPAAPSTSNVPGNASVFETPIEGGLAGIGLPTQRLPDGFAKP